MSLRELKIEMAKVEAARQDVEAREQQVRRTALALAEITVFLTTVHHRFVNEETHALESRWFNHKVSELLDMVAASSAERTHTFRLYESLKQIDALRDKDPEASSKLWDSTWKEIRDGLDQKTTRESS